MFHKIPKTKFIKHCENNNRTFNLVVLAVWEQLDIIFLTKCPVLQIHRQSELLPPAPTTAVVSPTPDSEDAQVDQIDTTFPESDVKAIQTDLQGL